MQRRKEVFITEGAFDMLTLLQWGYPAVALLGSHLEREWVDELVSNERIYIVTDSDAAGRRSASTLAETFGERVTIIPQLPVKDINELALLTDGKEIFTRLLSQVRHRVVEPSAQMPACDSDIESA